MSEANASRFSGVAGLYDRVRPTPPAELADLLVRYAGGRPATVVDLGCGSGLSSRWAAGWSDAVVGVEPNADMRAVAEASSPPNVRFVDGFAHDTGLPASSADVVLAVQAFHWMEPAATIAEIARLLRPGGVFAAADCDWPPALGSAAAEKAWAVCRHRLVEEETRVAGGVPGTGRYGADDVHEDRTLTEGVRSWPKRAHLANLEASGRFEWCTEVALHGVEDGDAARFVGLLRSQGDYQALRRAGLGDGELGVVAFERDVHEALRQGSRPFLFTWRARLGVLPESGEPAGRR